MFAKGEINMNAEKEVIEAISKVAKGKEVTLDSNIKELGMDSLDVVDMLMDIEDKYGIEFENEEMTSLVTIRDVVNSVEKKLNK
jgi:acyl carrier protein